MSTESKGLFQQSLPNQRQAEDATLIRQSHADQQIRPLNAEKFTDSMSLIMPEDRPAINFTEFAMAFAKRNNGFPSVN